MPNHVAAASAERLRVGTFHWHSRQGYQARMIGSCHIPVRGGGGVFFFNYCLSSLSFDGGRARSELDLRVARVPGLGTRGYPLAHALRASIGLDTTRLRGAER